MSTVSDLISRHLLVRLAILKSPMCIRKSLDDTVLCARICCSPECFLLRMENFAIVEKCSDDDDPEGRKNLPAVSPDPLVLL